MPVGGAYLFLKFICIIACYIFCGYGGIGRHKGLKIPREQYRAGSSPATGIWCYTEYSLYCLTWLQRVRRLSILMIRD